MKNMVKGAGAPAVPAHRPLTLFNTLITVPKNTDDALGFQRDFSSGKKNPVKASRRLGWWFKMSEGV